MEQMWIVEYFEGSIPQYFICDQADNWHHAYEQCQNANPGCAILRVGRIDWTQE